MEVKSVCLCVLVLSLQLVNVRGQDLTSPCPGVFDFDKYGNDGSTVHGVINLLKPDDGRPVSVLEVKINFTVAGPILNKYKGNISPGTSNQVQKYNQGKAIKYQVFFPKTEKPPKVTALIINGDIICHGSGDEPGEHILSLTLRHQSKSRAPVDKPVTSSYESGSTGTNTPTHTRGQTYHSSMPRPITLSLHDRVNTPITTDECGLVAGRHQIVPLIYNGLSYERGEIPWLVAIYKTGANNFNFAFSFICGGTLVSDRHVITAAHCIKSHNRVTPIAKILIKVGVYKLNDLSDDFTVTRRVVDAKTHEEYDSSTLQNDILILTLDKRVTFNSYIRPACLWSGNTELLSVVGDKGVVAGWGTRGELETGLNMPDEPQMARIPIVSTDQCKASKSSFHYITYNTTLCAGGRDGVGPCTGDSGGGLYLLEDGRWRLRGVVSVAFKNNGYNICNLNEYVVFTDTAQYLPWIKNIISVK